MLSGRMVGLLAVVTLVAASGCLSTGPLTDAQDERIIETFEEKMADIDGYSATVETTMEVGNVTTRMVIEVDARPDTGEASREVLDPDNLAGDVVVRNGTHTVSYDASENEVFVTELADNVTRNPITEVTELVETHEVYYNGTDTVEGEEVHKAMLVPGEEVPADTPITVWVDEETMFPVKMQTKPKAGNWDGSMTIVYSDVDLDPDLGDAIFTFDIPANATVTTPEDVRSSS